GIGVGAILRPNIEHLRLKQRSKTTLLTIQTALQNYHVEKEVYPQDFPLNGHELISLLIESGHLIEPPVNPYTRRPYESGGETIDRLEYSTTETFETYSLKLMHLKNDDPFMILDSTEHQSLE
ncbi:MAG: hypothetical protein AAF492_15715, partial [Verrucomicrobiota bacterium]